MHYPLDEPRGFTGQISQAGSSISERTSRRSTWRRLEVRVSSGLHYPFASQILSSAAFYLQGRESIVEQSKISVQLTERYESTPHTQLLPNHPLTLVEQSFRSQVEVLALTQWYIAAVQKFPLAMKACTSQQVGSSKKLIHQAMTPLSTPAHDLGCF